MKVFVFNEEYSDFRYPEDVKRIMGYLNERGTVNVSIHQIESLYRDYCDEVWAAGWMELDDNILFSFAEWLSDHEI